MFIEFIDIANTFYKKKLILNFKIKHVNTKVGT